MTDSSHQFTVVQHHEVHPPESEISLVPNRVLRHLYVTVQRFHVLAPHLPSAPHPDGATAAQACLLAELTAAICARKHDRLFNVGAAARLAQGETFAELLQAAPAPAPAATHDALPSGLGDRFSLDQFAATMAFISKLRGEQCVFFVLLGEHPLDQGFRRCLRVCAECRLPVLFYIETCLHLSAGKGALHLNQPPADLSGIRGGKGESLRSIYAESGVPVITTDVHDPVALYRVTTEAIHHARFGQGATVIESVRVVAAGKRARLATPADPLEFMRGYMQARGTWDDEWAREQHRAAAAELQAALAAV